MKRVYLDHNATTPLRAEARDAMLAAMDVCGNPSSVHAEGRAAKGLVERARAQVGALVGVDAAEVVFCGSATEAAAQVLQMPWSRVIWSGVEHDCIAGHASTEWSALTLDARGGVGLSGVTPDQGDLLVVQGANSETGICQDPRAVFATAGRAKVLVDAVQFAGKRALNLSDFVRSGFAMVSAHKLGGPKGIGALIVPRGMDVAPLIRGGGQEMGRRSGTENVIGIAGFGAAAEAAGRDVAAGRWEEVAQFRDILESAIAAGSNNTIFVGNNADRLPNTSCMLTPGWRGETQVMQMDLARFAVSAGSACSSGKVKASTVLRAMGFDENDAASAIRVSLGLDTSREEVLRFAETWVSKLSKHEQRAA